MLALSPNQGALFELQLADPARTPRRSPSLHAALITAAIYYGVFLAGWDGACQTGAWGTINAANDSVAAFAAERICRNQLSRSSGSGNRKTKEEAWL